MATIAFIWAALSTALLITGFVAFRNLKIELEAKRKESDYQSEMLNQLKMDWHQLLANEIVMEFENDVAKMFKK